MNDINKLFGEVNVAFEEFKKANDDRLAKIENQKYAPADLEAKVNNINTDITNMLTKMEDIKSQMERAASIDDVANNIKTAEEAKAFNAFLREGKGMERKAITVGTPSAGGYAVPEGLVTEFDRILVDSSPVRQVARVVATSTGTWERLVGQNDAASGWTTETGSRTATNTPTLGQVLITAQEMYANASVSQTALDDIFYNVEAELMVDLMASFSRLEAAAFVNGNGSGQPKGFLNYTKVTTKGTPEWGKLNNIETASTDAISAEDLIELVHTLRSGYRANGAFGMNRQILADIRKLKGSDNYYLWQPSLTAAAPSTILGYPVYEMEDMASSHTNGGGDTDAVVFADWKRFYVVVDRKGMTMLRDPYSNKPYVDFYGTRRVGGGILDSFAGVCLTINDA